MEKLWEKNVRRVVPYTPGEQPKQADVVKLNTNENPYPPAPGVQRRLAGYQTDCLRLYPDPAVSDLVEVLANRYQVNQNQVFVGVGSDDVLAMSFLTFFNSEKPIFFPDITYSFYDVWADLYRIPYETKALDEKFCIKVRDYFGGNGGIVLPNPNAPTAVYEPLESIETILQENPNVVVIIDEAYGDFAEGKSAVSLVDKYDNLLVVQTFSKSRSMAGMRIGFAIGSSELIQALNDVKYSFNSYTMSRLSIELGVESVLDEDYFQESVAKIKRTREAAKVRLAELGFTFPDSQANFIFASHKSVPAVKIFEELKKRHIYVRYFAKPRIDNYLRITIGTDEQMEKLYQSLEKIIL
ncbi:MAG: pyridoxal phosphate-dependent aminotransferase [Lachnospiraceae bacterium]